MEKQADQKPIFPPTGGGGRRLDSWKEIASYLNRSEKTVRRWEEQEGLPVHRLLHEKRGSIYAYTNELEAWRQIRKAVLDPPLVDPRQADTNAGAGSASSRSRAFLSITQSRPLWMLAGVLLASLCIASAWLMRAQHEFLPEVDFQRATDLLGLEDSPAISPDSKMLAFVALADNWRQIWVRLLTGGVPLQITHDPVNHQQPRWVSDSSSLIYYSPSPVVGKQGEIWEVPALGGPARRIASAINGGDVSRDGGRIAFFRSAAGAIELVVQPRHGSGIEIAGRLPIAGHYEYPRWSPDGHWIAFQGENAVFETHIYLVSTARGPVRAIAKGTDFNGISWMADSSSLVYSSSSGSTILYPPTFNLRVLPLNGEGDRQLTFGDVSYIQPDVNASGKLVASRIISRSDIWKFPIQGRAQENTRKAVRITHRRGTFRLLPSAPIISRWYICQTVEDTGIFGSRTRTGCKHARSRSNGIPLLPWARLHGRRWEIRLYFY